MTFPLDLERASLKGVVDALDSNQITSVRLIEEYLCESPDEHRTIEALRLFASH